MSLSRVMTILGKDLQVGPRSPMLFFAITMPFVLTFLLQVVFGTLFEPKPRLGIVDQGASEVTAKAQQIEGIQVTLLDNAGQLKDRVEANDLDAGLVLQEDFDRAVRSGDRPELEFYVGGESLASDRIILVVTAIDLIREVESAEPPTEIQVTTLGDEEALPLSQRLVPLILFYALFIAGVFVPAMSLVDEKEHHTLNAVLVTPARMLEIVFAKAIFGFALAVAMALITLLLNNALGSEPWALLAAIAVAALMASEISILYAAASKDAKALYTLIKSMGIFLFAPVIFYIWPELPQWIAKIFPTFWMIDPIYEVGVMGGGFAEIQFEIAVALVICAGLLPVISILSGRMEKNLAD